MELKYCFTLITRRFFRIPLTFSGQENPQQVHCEWIPESEQIEILLESSEVEWVLFNIDQQGSTFLTFKKVPYHRYTIFFL